MNLFYGILWGIIGQLGSYMQLQASIRYGWYEKYYWPLLLVSIPIGLTYIKSVEYFIKAFDGQLWPSRLMGFSIGIIVFSIMSAILFKEPMTLKTIISLILGFTIVGIQIFAK